MEQDDISDAIWLLADGAGDALAEKVERWIAEAEKSGGLLGFKLTPGENN